MNEIKDAKLTPGTPGVPPAAQQANPVQQVDPSRPYASYQFIGIDGNGAEHLLAQLIAVSEDGQGFKKDHEYWLFDESRTEIDTLEFNSLYVKKAPAQKGREPPFPASKANFVCSLNPDWSPMDPDFPVDCHHYDDSFGACGLRLKVRRPDVNSEWQGTITWVRPMERYAPLFLSKDDYRLTKTSQKQGQSVMNFVGVHWTGPVTNYGDRDWRDPVGNMSIATGIQVQYGGTHYGIVNARLVYGDGTFSNWASDDSGDDCPPDKDANLGSPVTQVSVRTGWYLNYSLGLVNLDCGGGWVTPFESDDTISVYIPPRCAVVGIQGKKRAKYGLVDMKIAYREVP